MMSRRVERLSRSMRRLLGTSLLLATQGAACAHTTWADGLAVPEWVTKTCCGPADAHHLTPDQVHRTPGGYWIDGYPRMIYDFQVLPSQDGEYWAFYSESVDSQGEKIFTSVFCFFAPSSS